MTPVDDIRVGMFVAICQYRGQEQAYPWEGCQEPRFDGAPLEVLEVCLPFLCVTDGRKRFAVDVRLWGVQKVSPKYAAAMQTPESAGKARFLKGKRKKKPKPDPRSCPRCHTRMVERLIVEVTGNHWRLVCPECGKDSGPVSKPSG